MKESVTIKNDRGPQNCLKELIELKSFDHYFKTDPVKLQIVLKHLQEFFQKTLSATEQAATSV